MKPPKYVPVGWHITLTKPSQIKNGFVKDLEQQLDMHSNNLQERIPGGARKVYAEFNKLRQIIQNEQGNISLPCHAGKKTEESATDALDRDD